jgi:hypothetical protein
MQMSTMTAVLMQYERLANGASDGHRENQGQDQRDSAQPTGNRAKCAHRNSPFGSRGTRRTVDHLAKTLCFRYSDYRAPESNLQIVASDAKAEAESMPRHR